MKLIVPLLMVASGFNMTELMMKETNGNGCAQNEYFSLRPRNAFCCEANPEDPWVLKGENNREVWRLQPTVCLSRGSRTGPNTKEFCTRPGCACKKGHD